jgi:hydrogenase small subunit
MPGFPDKFMPFMDQPSGASLSSMLVKPYGALIRMLRGITNHSVNEEPKWRHNRPELTTGADPRWGNTRTGSPR